MKDIVTYINESNKNVNHKNAKKIAKLTKEKKV